jgi:hypothetical protein
VCCETREWERAAKAISISKLEGIKMGDFPAFPGDFWMSLLLVCMMVYFFRSKYIEKYGIIGNQEEKKMIRREFFSSGG